MSKVMLVKVAIYLLLVLMLGLVMMQFLSVNQEEVTVTTILGELEGYSIGRLLIFSFIGGGVVGFLIAFLPSLMDMYKVKRLQSQLNSEKERVQALERKEKAMVAHADLPGQ